MRSPSSRVLDTPVDFYSAVVGQDASGGPTFTYGAIPTLADLPCSPQAGAVMEIQDEQNRLIQEREWKLVFGRPIGPKVRDKFVFVDRAGVTHTVFAHVERDEAGRGSTYVARCIERL